MAESVLLVLGLVLLAALIHELGHILVSMVVGLPIAAIFIGWPARPKLIWRTGGISWSLSPYIFAIGLKHKQWLAEVAPWKSLLTILAGPGVNLAAVWLTVAYMESHAMAGNIDFNILITLASNLPQGADQFWLHVWIWLNLAAAVTNLLPIPPLDGGNALMVAVLGLIRTLWPQTSPGVIAFGIRLEKASDKLISSLLGLLLLAGLVWLVSLYLQLTAS